MAVTFEDAIEKAVQVAILRAHPVGSLYWSSRNVSPQELFGGVWERVKDKFILAAGDAYEAGSTGGEAAHTLSAREMPWHGHNTCLWNVIDGTSATAKEWSNYGATFADKTSWGGLQPRDLTWAFNSVPIAAQNGYGDINGRTDSAGNSEPHNNMPPFETYYCWKRIA